MQPPCARAVSLYLPRQYIKGETAVVAAGRDARICCWQVCIRGARNWEMARVALRIGFHAVKGNSSYAHLELSDSFSLRWNNTGREARCGGCQDAALPCASTHATAAASAPTPAGGVIIRSRIHEKKKGSKSNLCLQHGSLNVDVRVAVVHKARGRRCRRDVRVPVVSRSFIHEQCSIRFRLLVFTYEAPPEA